MNELIHLCVYNVYVSACLCICFINMECGKLEYHKTRHSFSYLLYNGMEDSIQLKYRVSKK
jgi:hypothetical protein